MGPPGRSVAAPSGGSFRPPVLSGAPSASRLEAHAAPSVDLGLDDVDFARVKQGGAKKFFALALAAAAVGGLVGYIIGGLSEQDRVAQLAVTGARGLSGEIEKANAELRALEEKLGLAAKKLSAGKYPEAEVKALGAINVPFDGALLTGRGIGRFKPALVNQLIAYAAQAARANEQKDKIRGLLSFSKKAIEGLVAEREKPYVHWGVYVRNGPGGPWANMTRLSEPFPVEGEGQRGWPTSIKLREGEQTHTLPRYSGGDPTRSRRRKPELKLIPVAPATEGAVCSNDALVQVRRELNEMQKLIVGDSSPGREQPGVVALGEGIVKQLGQIGG